MASRIEKDEKANKGLEIDGQPSAIERIYDASCIIIIFHVASREIASRNRRYRAIRR